MPAPYTGGCACGAVRYRIDAEPYTSYCCHCTECQKRTSSAFGISAQVPSDALAFERGTPKERPRTADSGNVLRIGFCGDCGTSLYSAADSRPHIQVVYAGSLDEPDRIPIRLNIWTASALPWVHLDPAVPNEPRQPDMRKYFTRPPE